MLCIIYSLSMYSLQFVHVDTVYSLSMTLNSLQFVDDLSIGCRRLSMLCGDVQLFVSASLKNGCGI